MSSQKNKHHLVPIWLTIIDILETSCGVIATRKDATENELRFKGFSTLEKMCTVWIFVEEQLTKKMKNKNGTCM